MKAYTRVGSKDQLTVAKVLAVSSSTGMTEFRVECCLRKGGRSLHTLRTCVTEQEAHAFAYHYNKNVTTAKRPKVRR